MCPTTYPLTDLHSLVHFSIGDTVIEIDKCLVQSYEQHFNTSFSDAIAKWLSFAFPKKDSETISQKYSTQEITAVILRNALLELSSVTDCYTYR